MVREEKGGAAPWGRGLGRNCLARESGGVVREGTHRHRHTETGETKRENSLGSPNGRLPFFLSDFPPRPHSTRSQVQRQPTAKQG